MQNMGNYPWYRGTDIPTMGQARGKIVLLLSRVAEINFGYYFPQWNDNVYTDYTQGGKNYTMWMVLVVIK